METKSRQIQVLSKGKGTIAHQSRFLVEGLLHDMYRTKTKTKKNQNQNQNQEKPRKARKLQKYPNQEDRVS